jgi:hypothetical protein
VVTMLYPGVSLFLIDHVDHFSSGTLCKMLHHCTGVSRNLGEAPPCNRIASYSRPVTVHKRIMEYVGKVLEYRAEVETRGVRLASVGAALGDDLRAVLSASLMC